MFEERKLFESVYHRNESTISIPIHNVIISLFTRYDSNINADLREINRYFILKFNISDFPFVSMRWKYTVNLSTTIVQETLYSFYLKSSTHFFFLVCHFRFRAYTERDKTGGKIFEES